MVERRLHVVVHHTEAVYSPPLSSHLSDITSLGLEFKAELSAYSQLPPAVITLDSDQEFATKTSPRLHPSMGSVEKCEIFSMTAMVHSFTSGDPNAWASFDRLPVPSPVRPSSPLALSQ